jgi:hypothetical protein
MRCLPLDLENPGIGVVMIRCEINLASGAKDDSCASSWESRQIPNNLLPIVVSLGRKRVYDVSALFQVRRDTG